MNNASLAVFTPLLQTSLIQKFSKYQGYIEKTDFTDIYTSAAKAAKASLFTGAQASKKLKKAVFPELADISESDVLISQLEDVRRSVQQEVFQLLLA